MAAKGCLEIRAEVLLLDPSARQNEPKRCSDPFHCFHTDRATLRLNEAFHDRQSEPNSSLFLRIGLEFFENIFKAAFWNAGSIVADQTFDRAARISFASIDDHLAAWRIGDGIREQILKDTFKQTRVRIDD